MSERGIRVLSCLMIIVSLFVVLTWKSGEQKAKLLGEFACGMWCGSSIVRKS
jgi:hypothetical protein